MSEADLLVKQPSQVWTVHAHRGNTIVSMAKTFGLIGDGDTVHERIELKKATDPEWANQWRGWGMYPVRLDAGVKI